MVYWISLYLLKFLTKIYFRGKAYGTENLPEKGPYIGVINHNSFMDIPIISLVIRQKVYTMAKDSLFKLPLLSQWLRAVGMFPVVRNTSDKWAFEHSLAILKRGEILFISPEGTRKRQEGEERPRPRTGFVRLAQIVGCPVVPVALYGTRRALPPGAWIPRPVQLSAMVGKPFYLKKIEVSLEKKDQMQQQANMVMDIIYDMVKELEDMSKKKKH